MPKDRMETLERDMRRMSAELAHISRAVGATGNIVRAFEAVVLAVIASGAVSRDQLDAAFDEAAMSAPEDALPALAAARIGVLRRLPPPG